MKSFKNFNEVVWGDTKKKKKKKGAFLVLQNTILLQDRNDSIEREKTGAELDSSDKCRIF